MRYGTECLYNGQYPIRLFPSIVLTHCTLNTDSSPAVWSKLHLMPEQGCERCIIIVVTIAHMWLLNYNNIDLTFLSQSLRAVTGGNNRRSLGKHNPLSQYSQSQVPAAVQAISFKIFSLVFVINIS